MFKFRFVQYLVAIVLLFCAGQTKAQEKKGELENKTSAPQLESSLLWKIKGKGIKRNCYLFGTIHIIGAKDFFWEKHMAKAFKKADKLVMEMDMNQMMMMSMKMMQAAKMKDNTLSDLLSKEDYLLVKNYFTKETTSSNIKMLPFTTLETWKPMMVSSLLYTEMIEGPTKSYEMELTTQARKEGKTFGGLETIEQQLAVFEGVSYKDQAQMLVETIQELKSGKPVGESEFGKMIELYKKQNIAGLLQFMSKSFDKGANTQDVMLNDRNKNWIPQIIELCEKESVFIAVGAGHLPGEQGVIELLRKKGYKVTAVTK